MNIVRRHLPYRQLLTAGRCVNAPVASTKPVTAARHNVAARQYPILLAFCLAIAGFVPGSYLSGVSTAIHHHRVCHFEAHPGSRYTIVCHWVRS